MNEFIDFKPQDAQLPGFIRFSFTKKAFGSISKDKDEAVRRLMAFSKSRVLLVTLGKDKGIYEVFTSEGSFLCRIADDNNAMLVMGFYKNNLMKQNNAMRNGICFRVSSGIIIQIKLTDPYELYFDIVNGSRYEDNAFVNQNVSAALAIVAQKMAETRQDTEEEEEVDEEYQPEKKLLNLLQVAESYSILANELEEKKANSIGNIPYTSISSAEYDRIDRVAYQFGVKKIDENTFKVGVQVEIEDLNQERHSAEIIELVKKDEDSPATAIVLLFTEHIDISDFAQSGWFNLSFSTVNKDVQLAANEKIRTGEAASKYMDAIFGRSESAGFDNLDTSEVKKKLMEKKYPPNDSQMNAIFAGINAKDVFLVMGPPGTGKTTVILEWVKYFVKQGKRVLVSSQNNKAVDNVLARIADEKYIDIIRVGSESKLQSEVIPYMFENKVTQLRENISSNSEEKIKIIDLLVNDWKKYLSSLEKTTSVFRAVQQAREQFKTAAESEFMPLYRRLRDLYKKHADIQREKKAVIYHIKVLKDKIDKYEAGGNALLKMLSKGSHESNLMSMRGEVAEYEQLKKQEQSVVSEYNSLRNKYSQEYELLRDVDLPNLSMAIEDQSSALSALTGMPAERPENIWGLYRNCYAMQINNAADCMKLQELIKENNKRAAQLRAALMMWKGEIESQQNYALNEIVLESVDLVGATCIGINSQKRFASLDFDVTIIDEAGQIQVHNALVPMSVSNKLIMLGDHKQIPPTADQELVDLCEENGVKPDLLSMSLFEKMYYDLPEDNKIMLDTQYRMPAEIADTISEWFYEGKYFSPEFKKNLPSLIPELSAKPYVIIDTSKETKRFERKIEGAGCDNALEASIIYDLISMIASNPENDLKEIGVISAYKSQVKLIKNKLQKILANEVVNEMVATLDSYQGQERDIILYSFTKSSKDSPKKRRIGFLNELRRLNVAMTRCKKMLILIGDMDFLGGCQHCDKDDDGNLIYDKSEKQFSDFINKMVGDVKSGRGDFIAYKDFKEKVG